jgi:hypothetical protein
MPWSTTGRRIEATILDAMIRIEKSRMADDDSMQIRSQFVAVTRRMAKGISEVRESL